MLFPQGTSLRSRWTLGGVIAATMIAATQVFGAVTAIVGNTNDYSVAATGLLSTTGATFTVGAGGSPASVQDGILIFTLPTLATGQTVGPLTSLSVVLSAKGSGTTLNGDLWGVGNFPTTLPTDAGAVTNFFANSDDNSANPNPTASDLKIMDNYLAPTTGTNTTVSTPTGASNVLQSYIQSFYTKNPTYNFSLQPAYIYLRINPDMNVLNNKNRYIFDSAEATPASLQPVLNLDFVDGGAAPEPSAYGLVIGGAAVLLVARRSRFFSRAA